MPPKKTVQSEDSNGTAALLLEAIGKAPSPVRRPFNPNSTLGQDGMGSAFRVGDRGIDGKMEYRDNGGNIFGVKGGVGYDAQNVINADSAKAALYAKLNPLKGLNIRGSVDKDKFWDAAMNYQLNDKLGFEASTNADKEYELGVNYQPNEDSMVEASYTPELMRAAANWEMKKNLALSADISKRKGGKPRFGANVEYTF